MKSTFNNVISQKVIKDMKIDVTQGKFVHLPILVLFFFNQANCWNVKCRRSVQTVRKIQSIRQSRSHWSTMFITQIHHSWTDLIIEPSRRHEQISNTNVCYSIIFVQITCYILKFLGSERSRGENTLNIMLLLLGIIYNII